MNTRRKPQAFAEDAVSLWILNRSPLIINELALYDAKPVTGNFSDPYRLSMAQFSVRGTCGFVLVGSKENLARANAQYCGSETSSPLAWNWLAELSSRSHYDVVGVAPANKPRSRTKAHRDLSDGEMNAPANTGVPSRSGNRSTVESAFS